MIAGGTQRQRRIARIKYALMGALVGVASLVVVEAIGGRFTQTYSGLGGSLRIEDGRSAPACATCGDIR